MNKEKWSSMTDEQKTTFMRNVFKTWHFGEDFDYAERRRFHDDLVKERMHYGEFENPCLVLEIVDPIMAFPMMSWLYGQYGDDGKPSKNGESAPLFGYNLKEIYFDKGSLMGYSSEEEDVLRRAFEIIKSKMKNGDNNG